jgi:hypothetical protein
MTLPTATPRSAAATIAVTVSWALLSACTGLIAWLSWLLKYGYKAEVGRCGRVPDEYYPEIVWLFLLFPTGFAVLLSIAGILLAGRMGRWAWILLTPTILTVGWVAWVAWMGADGCAISFER